MFSVKHVNDALEYDYLTTEFLQHTKSLLKLWFQKTYRVVRRYLRSSSPNRMERHTAIGICTIFVLIWLQAFNWGGISNSFDMSPRASNQLKYLEIPISARGHPEATSPKRVVVETLLHSETYEAAHDPYFSSENGMMQSARDIALRVCQKERAREEGNMLILIKTSGNDTSDYFSFRDSSLQQSVQGGFLFDCPKPLMEINEQRRVQPQSGMFFIGADGGHEKDIMTWAVSRPSPSRASGSGRFYNIALAMLCAGLFFWVSTRKLESEEETPRIQVESVRRKPVKPEMKAAVPIPIEKFELKEVAVASSPRAMQATELCNKTNDEVVSLGLQNKIRHYNLETQLGDAARAVQIRRRIVAGKAYRKTAASTFDPTGLPFENYDYERVRGVCCESVIGYLPVPVGVAGPLNVNGKQVFIPMATTEGALVASTNRGCTAINLSGGVTSLILADGMTRGPVVRFPSLQRASDAKIWLDSEDGLQTVKEAFNSTSQYGRLQSIKTAIVGSDLFIRFKAKTGDAMGMNMISKGVERALAAIVDAGFDDMWIISLSGNYCTDKKSSAINWVDGRGKSVAAQATISSETLKKVLKVDIDNLVELNTTKNLIGSAVAGSIGGFNAHAANIVSAIFLATGQDIAQNIGSSSCLTTMRNVDGNLQISVSMPSIEVGTVGGGTVLEAQATMLDLLGVRGGDKEVPGAHAQELACLVAAAVLAGELSLCSALATGSLVSSHMALNRK